MKAADCGRLAWALSVSCLTASRAAAVRSGHSLIYAPGAPVYGMTPAPALLYEARLYEEDLKHWARYEAAYILMAADARARDCLRKAIADACAAGMPLERYQRPPVTVPVSSGIDVLTAVTLHAAYAAGADVCRACHYSADAIYTPCTPGYEMLKEWSRKISAEAVGHAAGQVRQQCTDGRARILLAARECTPRFSVFETKAGIYEREILINASDKNIAPAC